MRLLEERKDYRLDYDIYQACDERVLTMRYDRAIQEEKRNIYTVVEVALATETYYDIQSKKLTNLQKDLKSLSKKLIREWKAKGGVQ